MQSFNATSKNWFGGLFIALFGLCSISAADAQIWVANRDSETIGEYNATTGAVINSSHVSGSGVSNPLSLAISGNNLFVLNAGNTGNTIGEYNATTGAAINASLISGPGLAGILAIAIGTQATPPVIPTSNAVTVSSGSPYWTVPAVTSTGGLGSTVSLLAGVNNSGSSQTVTLGSTNAGANFTSLASDVVSVSGNDGSVFALQLTFDLNAANLAGGANKMALLWLNPANSQWENAVLVDHGLNTTNPLYLDYQGSFASFEAQYAVFDSNLTLFLGAYGVDTLTDTVWAVIDHNSNFGAGNPLDAPTETESVPEPSTWALLLGGLGLLAF